MSDRALDPGWHPEPIKDASILDALQTSPAAANGIGSRPERTISETRPARQHETGLSRYMDSDVITSSLPN
jgi:hypothetical protein